MKIELLGNYHPKGFPYTGSEPPFYTWTLWLNEDHEIAHGRAKTKKQAREDARQHWIQFQADVCALRVPLFREWA